MKLHRLDATAFGPYPGTVEIDFDRLDEAGVYLLTGPTGAGKTTVLDAISYALFGEIPRAPRAAKVVSDHRELETTPSVVLEATIGADRVRIKRSPKHDRPKLKGTGTANQDQSVLLEIHRDGTWSPVGEKWNEVNAELVRRVGMTAEQFCQVVMLPQGDFARFLKADVRTRQELLQKLFPGIDLAWMEQWFADRARRDGEARDAKEREIADRFEQVRTIASALAEEDEDPLPNTGEAAPALAWIETREELLASLFSARKEAQARATEEAGRADRELKALTDRASAAERKRAAEAKLAELEQKAPWRRELQAEIRAAEKAAAVRQLASRADELEENAATTRARFQELEVRIGEHPLVRDLDRERLPEAETAFRAEVTTILNFEKDELPRKKSLGHREGELLKALEELSDDGPGSEREKVAAALEQASTREQEARRRWLEIREARTRNMAAELARELEEEEPCPVCGSLDHPDLAHAEGPRFSREEEEAAETDHERARAATQAARDAVSETESRLVEQQTRFRTELTAARKELEKLSAREGELAGDAVSLGERRDQVGEAADLIHDFLAAGQKLTEQEAAAREAKARTETEAGERDFESVAAALDASRSEERLIELSEALSGYDQALAVTRSQLAELEEIDATGEIDLEPARIAAEETAARRNAATTAAGIARENLVNFRQVTGTIPGLFEELEPLRQQAATSEELKRMTNGRNERKMNLSIFVLATRLRQVIEAANRHLERMSDQRYELVYTGDLVGHGATSGLGIEVFDSHTSQNRPTSSLSGGESFWASLSLALGLAEIVAAESGGKRIETLFIDEGFGTLDPESLGNVIDVIDSLREGGRSVGVVSHVEEMKNRIPAQIRVSPTRRGSTLEVVV